MLRKAATVEIDTSIPLSLVVVKVVALVACETHVPS
jgi:hypothetical protein